jgi:FdhD protein
MTRDEASVSLGITSVALVRVRAGRAEPARDDVAVEAPLEIRIGGEVLATTMRTPGNDVELCAGLLLSEGILRSAEQIQTIAHLPVSGLQPAQPDSGNVIDLTWAPGHSAPERALGASRRGTLTTSACGVCGRLAIEDLLHGLAPSDPSVRFNSEMLAQLPATLARQQPNFARTGGLHAAAVARSDGNLLVVREDVGRHNAVDKALGRLLLDGLLPMAEGVLVVSGRASFEIVQKAAAAGLSALVSVSAPSSLAIDTAERVGLLLIGFARDGGFNAYAGHARLRNSK